MSFAPPGAAGLLRSRRGPGTRVRGRALPPAFAVLVCAVLGCVPSGAGAAPPNARQLIDAYVPAYHFRETHSQRMRATPRQVFAAAHAVRASEVRGLDAFLWLRTPRGPRSRDDQALAAHPLLAVLGRANFVVLAEQPGQELVIGAIGQFWANRSVPIRTPAQFRAFRDPRFARIAMNLRVRDEGNGWCRVTTETRVVCLDPRARRRFSEYWRVSYPGSALIRNQWLAAIQRRAERARG